MSTSDMETLLGLLGDVNTLLEGVPGGADIFSQLRSGKLHPDEAVQKLAEIARNTGLLDQLEETSGKVEALLPQPGPLDEASLSLRDRVALLPVSPEQLAAANRPVQMKTSTGIDQLNPLYEASIVERVSLDGDAPELRSGTLPEGGRPAVPVITTSRDPVVIGLMLERASNEVRGELRQEVSEHSGMRDRLLQLAGKTALAEGRDLETALQLTKRKLPPIPVGVSGYEAGFLPALRKTTPPDPHVTAALNLPARRLATFSTLATTQGRVSVAPVIESALRDFLAEKGLTLKVGKPESESLIVWAVQAFGPEDLSDEFNPIQVAIESLGAQCLQHALSSVSPPSGWAIRVAPHQDISKRQFGWAVRFGSL